MKARLAPGWLTAGSLILVSAASAHADPLHWPFAFDPALAQKPAVVQQQLADGDAKYPEVPLPWMKGLADGPVALYLWKETAEIHYHCCSWSAGLVPFQPRIA